MLEISNDDLGRILGRMEAKLDEQVSASKRVEEAVASVDRKVTQRLDEHDARLRRLEVANPEELAKAISAHGKRIESLEQSAARAGVVAGIASGLTVSVLAALARAKLGL
jgi:L-ribulose-5-phosphate 3-epimerase UlaE